MKDIGKLPIDISPYVKKINTELYIIHIFIFAIIILFIFKQFVTIID